MQINQIEWDRLRESDEKLQVIANEWNSVKTGDRWSNGLSVAHKGVTDWWPELACLLDDLVKRDSKTQQEFINNFDYEAAVNHLEWLRGLRISVGMMAELISAGQTGEWGSK